MTFSKLCLLVMQAKRDDVVKCVCQMCPKWYINVPSARAKTYTCHTLQKYKIWIAFTLLQAKCNAVFLSASCSAKSALAPLTITSVTQHNSGDKYKWKVKKSGTIISTSLSLYQLVYWPTALVCPFRAAIISGVLCMWVSTTFAWAPWLRRRETHSTWSEKAAAWRGVLHQHQHSYCKYVPAH